MINKLIKQLKQARQLQEDSQEQLLAYVRNSSNGTLEHRFNIWVAFVKKEQHEWTIHEQDVPVIGKWVDTCNPNDYDKYRDYDWEYLLDAFEDALLDPESKWSNWATSTGLTVDEFKELLIRENFGDFTHDW